MLKKIITNTFTHPLKKCLFETLNKNRLNLKNSCQNKKKLSHFCLQHKSFFSQHKQLIFQKKA